MPTSDLNQRIQTVRRFNRFYTRTIGVLEEGHLKSSFSLAEVRVLYELVQRDQAAAAEIADELNLDAGYLSRILSGFEKRGFIYKRPSAADGRQNVLRMTTRGRTAFAPLDARADNEVRALLAGLPETEQHRLLGAMRTIERLLGARTKPQSSYLLRPHQPGDMGWVVHRHGVLYAEEYGYDERFEALVAEIVAKFIQNFDPKRERCWIAERDGENVGSVFLVKKSEK
ncbi:MAG TPA: MarR family winged helix-turn-helix transcriptional regulator, partial [Gemmataceae bacterium]